MNTLIETHPVSVDLAVNTVLCVECLKKPAVQVVVLPQSHQGSVAPASIQVAAITTVEAPWDDLENATWEDAEWR